MDEILARVCLVSGLTVQDIISKSRREDVVAARALFARKSKEVYGYSQTAIGRKINRTHANVQYLQARIKPSAFYNYYKREYDLQASDPEKAGI